MVRRVCWFWMSFGALEPERACERVSCESMMIFGLAGDLASFIDGVGFVSGSVVVGGGAGWFLDSGVVGLQAGRVSRRVIMARASLGGMGRVYLLLGVPLNGNEGNTGLKLSFFGDSDPPPDEEGDWEPDGGEDADVDTELGDRLTDSLE